MELLPKEKAKFLVAKKLVSGVQSARDKSVVIENTIGLETLFSLIARGMSDREVREEIGLTEGEYLFVVKGSPMLRKRYMEAKSFMLADISQNVLLTSGLVHSDSMSKDQKAAAEFHNRNIDRLLKIGEWGEQNTGIIVNNTVVVRGKGEIPEIPKELEEVIDVDFTVGT